MSGEVLRYSPSGHAVILPGDDPEAVVDALIAVRYGEEFCLSPSFDPAFVASLMAAGFLVMAIRLEDDVGAGPAVLLPKLHLERAVLNVRELHERRSVRRILGRYELRADGDFKEVLSRCVAVHGDDWLVEELRASFIELNSKISHAVRLVAFELYRGGKLVAGEFGAIVGGIYTSYSGYRDESSAGSVQLALTGRYLKEMGFAFWDLGMPMAYKTALGAESVDRAVFVKLFREARGMVVQSSSSRTIRA